MVHIWKMVSEGTSYSHPLPLERTSHCDSLYMVYTFIKRYFWMRGCLMNNERNLLKFVVYIYISVFKQVSRVDLCRKYESPFFLWKFLVLRFDYPLNVVLVLVTLQMLDLRGTNLVYMLEVFCVETENGTRYIYSQWMSGSFESLDEKKHGKVLDYKYIFSWK